MRTTAQYIQTLWEAGGPFTGSAGKPHTRVTVQAPWDDLSGDHKYDFLRTTYDDGVGIYKTRGIPLRWFQDAAQTQVEIEVPNIKQVHISRGIDRDAAQVQITLYNQQMFDNDSIPSTATEAGQPGYYTFNRGVSIDAQSRWGQEANSWENLLVPNAVIRTFQGYGGTDKTIAQALADGNITISGTWLLDTVEIHSNGLIDLNGRDGMKLLLDQQLYLPLVPKSRYPLIYQRYLYFNEPVRAHVTTSSTSTNVPAGDKQTIYETSSVDAWYDNVYGHNMLLHGHRPSDAFDGNHDTWFLGEGNSRADAAFAVNYLQALCGEQMNAVYIDPWAGNYTMYVSVMENGVWQGSDTVPYDPAELYGTQPQVVNTGANIPYVAKFGVPWETAQTYVLPRVYLADRVRVAFRDLTYTDYGPWHYRAGIREFKIQASQEASVGTSQSFNPLFVAADSHPDAGYVTSSVNWQVDAFGVARMQPVTGGKSTNNHAVWTLRITNSGNGWYACTERGEITCFGDAVFYGDPSGSLGDPPAADMAITPSGHGYWVIDSAGVIYNFGDAAAYAAVSASNGGSGQTWVQSMDSHPTVQGLWVLDANGVVTTRGGATNYGSRSPSFDHHRTTERFGDGARSEFAARIRSNSTGTGYWILGSAATVQAKGAATFYGEGPPITDYNPWWYSVYWQILPHSDDSGYLIMRGDGTISDFGLSPATWWYGSPIPGTTAQFRKDGNYLDYTDIIKDLALWAGFTFYEPDLADNDIPSVHGNLESTGAFSYVDLPPDLFDKRPVIDPMHQLKETVGYLLWVDEEGGLRFQSPNWWAPGNFDEEGNYLNEVVALDEAVTLIEYGATVADEPLRSEIIISSEDPDQNLNTTVTTRLIPNTARRLRGLVKPAMWINGYFLRPQEQKIMAELIALHINFQSRIGQITCVANPNIQIDDQVRIFERQTAETYIHYVRGIDTTHDLDNGTYQMTLTTHWLGDESEWSIQKASTYISPTDDSYPNTVFTITDDLATALRTRMGSKAANHFDLNLHDPITITTPGSQSGTGSAT